MAEDWNCLVVCQFWQLSLLDDSEKSARQFAVIVLLDHAFLQRGYSLVKHAVP